jgi:TPP-dependent pyruvate/acetoin dehydrogenase alpha subunit
LIIDQELMTAEDLAQLREEIAAEVNDAINTAQADPAPRASEEDWIAMSRRDLVDQPS